MADGSVKAAIEDRKILRALRLVFGRKLADLRDIPGALRPQAIEALKRARSNLVEFRRRHPELVDVRVKQQTLDLF